MVSIRGDEYNPGGFSGVSGNTVRKAVDPSRPQLRSSRKGHRRSAPRFERRLFTLTLAAVVVFFLFSGATSLFNLASGLASASQLGGAPSKTITVQPGDTLWQIASRYGDPDSYILDREEAIAHLNHLSDDASLVPGEKIKVPVGD